MSYLYNIFIHLLIFFMKIGASFNYKLKRGLAGRKQSLGKVKANFKQEDKVLWMHAASLGEYEQGLPVLEKLKNKFPDHKVLITFFSPSGYENVIKKKTIADVICYLPFDKKEDVKEFTSQFTTEIFFTVKYDFWYHLLSELKEKKTKIYVVSALFYETQLYFKPYGKWFVKELQRNIDWFFHQTSHSSAIAKEIGLLKSSTAGDTRFDRVKELALQNQTVPWIDDFKQNATLLVFGSSWETEERIAQLVHHQSPNTKLIIAPHDLKRIDNLKKIFPTALLYSTITENSSDLVKSGQILLIDSIGLLSKLYKYGDIAVVGGGFHSKGLHNILEAGTYGVPVFFGNHYKKNPEADALIAKNGGKSFDDEFFITPYLTGLLKHPEIIQQIGKNAYDFVHEQPNSTELIFAKINSDFN